MEALQNNDSVHHEQPADYETEHAVGVLPSLPPILVKVLDLGPDPLIFEPLPLIRCVLDYFLIDNRWWAVNDGLKANDGDAVRRWRRLDWIHSPSL